MARAPCSQNAHDQNVSFDARSKGQLSHLEDNEVLTATTLQARLRPLLRLAFLSILRELTPVVAYILTIEILVRNSFFKSTYSVQNTA